MSVEMVMTTYAVGLLKALKNAEVMAKYRTLAGDALARHGGLIVVPPTAPERMEGDAEAPMAIVILSFPSGDAGRAWLQDPDLASVHAMRREGADISFFLLDRKE
jgi:uncharacterized protein (DUF1330 family)